MSPSIFPPKPRFVTENRPQTLLFANSVGVQSASYRIMNIEGLRERDSVYRPYPRRLESLAIYRCRYKGSTFS